ncbi:protein PHR1-LIKE 1 [Citrus clementina]|uniref:protein PHR1-LIKE 1 n=1 Tax=Citrus clementina TaxID=85681 RepID=UPI000CED41BB|nr:protein PHR1-LIKE 1 [Citrus x clementina]
MEAQSQEKQNLEPVIEASLPPSNQFSGDNFSEKLSELDTLESLVLSSNHNRKFPRKISSIPTPSESSQNTKKYRSEKLISDQSLQGFPEKTVCINDIPQLYMKMSMQIREALQLQLELEKHLHDQLEACTSIEL